MKRFYDNDCNLTFKCYPGKEISKGYYDDEYCNCISQLNFWDDEGIKKFIDQQDSLGHYLSATNEYFVEREDRDSQLIFAFDDDILVGSALITTKNPPIASQLNKFNKDLIPVITDKTPLINIEYIATDPLLRGMGYGTRIIKGIKNLEKELTYYRENNGITAYVRFDNTPSKIAFLKNNFIIVNPPHLLNVSKAYHTLYSGKHAEILQKQ